MPVLWPYHPLTSFTEKLSWLTNIIGTRTNERRVSRRIPRKELVYNFLLTPEQINTMEGLIEENLYNDWYLADWSESIYISNIANSNISINTTGISLDGDYRVGEDILIINPSVKGSQQQVTITSISPTFIGVTTFINDHSEAIIVPLRTAFLKTQTGKRYQQRKNVSLSCTFQVRDNTEDHSLSPYTQYEGLDYLNDAIIFEGALNEQILQDVARIDNGVGVVVLEELQDYISKTRSISFRDSTSQARWRRKQWLYSIAGRDKPFWIRCAHKELYLDAPLNPNSDTISVQSFYTDASNYLDKHIVIENNRGTHSLHKISSVALSPGVDTLTITPNLSSDVNASFEVAFVQKVRLSSDEVSLNHVDARHTKVTLNVTEIP